MPTIERYRRYTATLRIRRGERWNVRHEVEPYHGTRVTVEAGWQFQEDDGRPEYIGEWSMFYAGESHGIPAGWAASGDLLDLEPVPCPVPDDCDARVYFDTVRLAERGVLTEPSGAFGPFER